MNGETDKSARARRVAQAISPGRRRCIAVMLAGSTLAALPRRGMASTFPSRPVRILVGQAPGGQTDIIARLVAQQFSTRWNQTVVVENYGGAAGTIAAGMVARAAADGHTLLMGSNASLAAMAIQPGNAGHDPVRDWALIGRAVRVAYVLAVRSGLGVATVREFVARARARPEALSLATAGAGSNAERAARLFERAAAIRFLEVPFKGGAPALQAVVAGQVDGVFCDLAIALPFAASGSVRIVAAASRRRLALAPDIPTFAEAALPGVVAEPWYALVAPTGTPRDIVAEIASALRAALAEADLVRRFAALGYEPVAESQEEFANAILAEVDLARGLAGEERPGPR